MKLQIEDVTDLNPIDKVIVHSIDWMTYQVFIIYQGKQHVLYQGKDPFNSRNLLDIQELFQCLDVESYVLRRPSSAYDEMVGQPENVFLDSFEISLPWKYLATTSH